MRSAIGIWFRSVRKEKNLTQSQASKLYSGFRTHEVGQVERGELLPSKRQAKKYAQALGVEKEFEKMWIEHLKDLNKIRSNVLGMYLQERREELKLRTSDMVRRVPSFSTADIRRVEEGGRVLTAIELVWFAIALELSDLDKLLSLRQFDEIQRAKAYFSEYALYGNKDIVIEANKMLNLV